MAVRRAPLALFALTLLMATMPSRAAELRWTEATPDAMADGALRMARAGQGPSALARLLLARSLANDASAGRVLTGLLLLGETSSPVAEQAAWLARAMRSDDPPPGVARDAPLNENGLIENLAVLGPFPNTGGGLELAEGPETAGHRYAGADYSQGTRAIRYVRSLPGSMSARGLPLDLYLYPRAESCAYLESAVVLAEPSAVLHVAATGSFRLLWDGAPALQSDEAHAQLRLDRASLVIEDAVGEHLLTLKICSGAQRDGGRVRLRLTDASGKPVRVRSSSSAVRLQAAADRPRTPAKLQPRATLLEQALAVGPDPTIEAALAAAVVRRLGGAEDLQSPRAPGLLVRVAEASEATANQLALAGALAPSAANRSGWLESALARAGREGDRASELFAARSLVESRLAAGLGDSAYASARSEPLGSARDAHAEWLRTLTTAELGGSGLRQSARAALTALSLREGIGLPVSALHTLADLHEDARPIEHLDALRRIVALEPDGRDAEYVAAHAPLGPRALLTAAREALRAPTSAYDVVRIGTLLLDAGHPLEAEAALALAAELSPNLPNAFAELARARSALSGGADPQSASALARARELAPSAAKLAAEQRFRQKPEQAADKQRDERFLIGKAEILARRLPAAKPGVFARELHWRRVVTLHPDQRVSQLVHYAREIVVEPRTENERYEQLPFASDKPEILFARVHRADGSESAPEELDPAEPQVRWPRLARGDVVEVALRTWTRGPIRQRGDVPFYFVDYVGAVDTHPVLYNDVILDAPLNDPIAFDVLNGKPDHQREEQVDGRRVTHIIWERPPIIPDEAFSPPSSELLPLVVGSPFSTWREFADWYQRAVAGFAEPDEQIKQLAGELTKGKAQREDKLRALFNFVADDIRYVNYVSGEWWLPNRPQHLLARRQGDCDDKAMLLISLLRAVDIEATEVLIQTRLSGQPSVLKSSRAAVPMFDHGIIYLPDAEGKGGRFLDATSPQSRLGALPAMDAGAMALFVDRGELKLVETPVASPAEHGVAARWTLTLDPSGGGELSAEESHVGDSAFYLRTYLAEPDARAQWVEQNLVGGWFPSIRLAPDVRFEGERPDGSAFVGYRARSDSLARREGRDLVVSVAPPIAWTAALAPLPKRTLPVVLPPNLAPRHRTMEITIIAPAGYSFAEAPPDVADESSPFGESAVSFVLSRDGRKLVLKQSFAFAMSRIEVASYPAWRAWLQRLDRLQRRSVRLVPSR